MQRVISYNGSNLIISGKNMNEIRWLQLFVFQTYQTPQPGMPILWMMLMPTWAMKTKKKAMKLKELSLLRRTEGLRNISNAWRIIHPTSPPTLSKMQRCWCRFLPLPLPTLHIFPNAHFGLHLSNNGAPQQQVFPHFLPRQCRHESATESRITPCTQVFNLCASCTAAH